MLTIPIKTVLAILLLSITDSAPVADGNQSENIKKLEGISIIGDKEAPKSLYIVPWQTAELKQSTSLTARMTDQYFQAVDRASFLQHLRLHTLSKSGWHRMTAAEP